MSQLERTPEIIKEEVEADSRFHRVNEHAQRAVVNVVTDGVEHYKDPNEDSLAKLSYSISVAQTYGLGAMAFSDTLRVIARLNEGEGKPITPHEDFKRGEEEDIGDYLGRIIRVQPWRMFESRGELTAELQHKILVFEVVNEMNNDGRGDDAMDIIAQAKDKEPLPFSPEERVRYSS